MGTEATEQMGHEELHNRAWRHLAETPILRCEYGTFEAGAGIPHLFWYKTEPSELSSLRGEIIAGHPIWQIGPPRKVCPGKEPPRLMMLPNEGKYVSEDVGKAHATAAWADAAKVRAEKAEKARVEKEKNAWCAGQFCCVGKCIDEPNRFEVCELAIDDRCEEDSFQFHDCAQASRGVCWSASYTYPYKPRRNAEASSTSAAGNEATGGGTAETPKQPTQGVQESNPSKKEKAKAWFKKLGKKK
jgi:hypothetical protein